MRVESTHITRLSNQHSFCDTERRGSLDSPKIQLYKYLPPPSSLRPLENPSSCPFAPAHCKNSPLLLSSASSSPMDSLARSLCDSSSPFDCLIFDLDDTLYPSNTGIAQACKKNIEDFLVQKCGFPEIKASSLRVELFKTYGSSLAGLRALDYNIDADDYHSFVHGRLPYDRIKPDSQLRNLLLSIKQRKIIFTNSDRNHADRALDRLGFKDCFEKIICFETMNPNLPKSSRPNEFPVLLKPSLDAMKIALDVAEVDPRRTLFLDDNVRNVTAGKAMGLITVLVGRNSKSKDADYALETVNNLPEVIPEIWGSSTDSDGHNNRTISRTKSQLDSFLASTSTAVGA